MSHNTAKTDANIVEAKVDSKMIKTGPVGKSKRQSQLGGGSLSTSEPLLYIFSGLDEILPSKWP